MSRTVWRGVRRALIGVAVAVGAIFEPMEAGAHPIRGSTNWDPAAGDLLGTSFVSRGDIVGFWQTVLLGYGNIPCSGVDGLFGPNTRQGTQDFQSFFGLIADGVVGPQTWGMASYLKVLVSPHPVVDTYRLQNAAPDKDASYNYFKTASSGFAAGEWAWSIQAPGTPEYVFTEPWESRLHSDHPGISFSIHCPK